MMVALDEWVCRRDDREIVLRGGGGEEVGAHVENVRQGGD